MRDAVVLQYNLGENITDLIYAGLQGFYGARNLSLYSLYSNQPFDAIYEDHSIYFCRPCTFVAFEGSEINNLPMCDYLALLNEIHVYKIDI